MSWIGFVCLALILCYSSYPGRVRKLERRIGIVGRKNGENNKMLKLINELIGKKCRMVTEDSYGSFDCDIIDTDDEWVKLKVYDKKNYKIKLVRISSINNIELINEGSEVLQ